MKPFKIILLTALTLFALESIIQEALQYYQDGSLEHHPQSIKALQLEAEQGNSDAAFLLATAYKNGKITYVNLDKAYYYYSLAAQKGDADAMLMLGWLDYRGTPEFGIRIVQAKIWFQEAAKLGVIEAAEMVEMLGQ